MLSLILIKTIPGKEVDVIKNAKEILGRSILEIKGEPFIYEFTGPYDVILCVDTEKLADFREVIFRLRQLPGVIETISCIAIK